MSTGSWESEAQRRVLAGARRSGSIRRLILIIGLLALTIFGTVSTVGAAGEHSGRATIMNAAGPRGVTEATMAETFDMAAPAISREVTLVFALANLGFLSAVTVMVMEGELRRKSRGGPAR